MTSSTQKTLRYPLERLVLSLRKRWQRRVDLCGVGAVTPPNVEILVLYYCHVQMILAGANSGPRAITMPEWIRRAAQ